STHRYRVETYVGHRTTNNRHRTCTTIRLPIRGHNDRTRSNCDTKPLAAPSDDRRSRKTQKNPFKLEIANDNGLARRNPDNRDLSSTVAVGEPLALRSGCLDKVRTNASQTRRCRQYRIHVCRLLQRISSPRLTSLWPLSPRLSEIAFASTWQAQLSVVAAAHRGR